jgi:opacity protein-like surface antigen
MKICNILTTSVIVALSATAITAQAATPYVEGQIGYANASKVNTNTYSGTVDGITATNLMGKLNYDSSASFGAEIGIKDLLVPNLRVGASFTTMKFDLKNAVISGSLTDGVDTVSGSLPISAADFATVGVSFDNRVNLYMANAYYDFKNDSKFTPFVGVGLGVADIKNAKDSEFTYSVNAGAKYNIDKNLYVGAKAAYTNINGPADQLGLKYQNIELYTANLSLGYEF